MRHLHASVCPFQGMAIRIKNATKLLAVLILRFTMPEHDRFTKPFSVISIIIAIIVP